MGVRPPESEQQKRRCCRAVLRAPIVHPRRLIALRQQQDEQEDASDLPRTLNSVFRSGSDNNGDGGLADNLDADDPASIRMSIVRVSPTPTQLLPRAVGRAAEVNE